MPIYTIALGTPDGVVEVEDQFGQMQQLQVPPDTETLQQVAEMTGGRYFDAPTAEDLAAVYESLGSKVGYTEQVQEVTQWFAAGALLLVRRRRRARRPVVQPLPLILARAVEPRPVPRHHADLARQNRRVRSANDSRRTIRASSGSRSASSSRHVDALGMWTAPSPAARAGAMSERGELPIIHVRSGSSAHAATSRR